MKKQLQLIIGLFFFLSSMLIGQTVIIDENFDSYNAGSKIAASTSSNWSTWSGASGGAEDGTISDAQAASGSNSLRISGTNDVVLFLSDNPLTSGRYKIQFKMFVNPNNYAYFNILQKFNGANSDWATQTYLRPNGNCTMDAGGPEAGQFTQSSGEWFDISYIIDLEDDFSTNYVKNTDEVISWRWGSGTSGASDIKTLDALNFYAWAAEGTPLYYIDDLLITQVDKTGKSFTLNGQINSNNQVELDWSGADDSADNYLVINHANVITNINDKNYVITKPYPQVFDLNIGAHTLGEGYFFSNDLELNLEGGVDRNFVLYEVGTGTWCPNCPSAARGVDDMHEGGFNVGVVEYHGGSASDIYINAISTARIGYYGLGGYPTTYIDGVLQFVGGSYSGNQFNSFKSSYDTRMTRRSLYDFDMQLENLGGREFKVTIQSDELYSFFDGSSKLRLVLTESHIPESWQGLPELNFVAREMYPNANGVEFTYGSGSESYETTFIVSEEYDLQNLELVGFVQNDATKEILTGNVIALKNILVSNENQITENLKLSPNPVSDFLTIENVANSAATIMTIDGKVLKEFRILSNSHTESTISLAPNIYIINIESDSGNYSQKFIKQ